MIVKTYANMKSAERAMRRRGLIRWQANPSYWRVRVSPQGGSLAPKRHFDIDSGLIHYIAADGCVTIRFYYYNNDNEPKHERRFAV